MLALLAPIVLAGSPRAHVDTVSFAHMRLGGERIELELEVDTDHLMQAIEAKPPLAADWSDAELRELEPKAIAYLDARWRLALDGFPATLTPRGFARRPAFDPMIQQERAVRLAFAFSVVPPRQDARATLLASLFEGIELRHQHVLLVECPDRPGAELGVPPGLPFHFTLPDAAPGAALRRLRTRAIEGAAVSFASPWLLLFLVALLVGPLPAGARAAGAAAAAAAAAASYSLVRAELIAPAPWAATAAAALSVAYLAAENRFASEVRLRLPTAAMFGLVHGMVLAARLRPGLLGATAVESALFAAVAISVAAVAAVALATLCTAARQFSARGTALVVDGALLLAGAGGVLTALVRRAAV